MWHRTRHAADLNGLWRRGLCAAGCAGGLWGNDKVGSLGLRVRRGRSYHGLSLNVDMDLEPFSRINPCGLSDIGVTQLSNLCKADFSGTEAVLLKAIAEQFKLDLSKPDNR